jgi:hypothetical protein
MTGTDGHSSILMMVRARVGRHFGEGPLWVEPGGRGRGRPAAGLGGERSALSHRIKARNRPLASPFIGGLKGIAGQRFQQQ